ncbi:MAG: hypothetical protein ACM3SO_18015 [Betaproteobacteria bacterium]
MASRRVTFDHGRASAWHLELMRAGDASAVLSMVKDYMVLLTPDERAQLPGGWTSERFHEAEDVMAYADHLARLGRASTLCRSDAQRALAFFMVAALRLSQLERHEPLRLSA